MENDKKLVALILDDDQKCERVAIVKNLGNKEYNKCLNEERAYKNGVKEEKSNLKANIENLHNYTNHLENNQIYLAKAIYDNFVDRGFLNDNEEFQKDFFNHIYKGGKLNLDKVPAEFITILRKVEYHNEEK